jgi:hypothetical protein
VVATAMKASIKMKDENNADEITALTLAFFIDVLYQQTLNKLLSSID